MDEEDLFGAFTDRTPAPVVATSQKRLIDSDALSPAALLGGQAAKRQHVEATAAAPSSQSLPGPPPGE